MMRLWLLIIIFEYNKLISNGNYCKNDRNSTHLYRIGRNIYIDNGVDSIWAYNTDQNKFLPYQYKLENIFGDNFVWVDTAFTYEFDRCNTTDRRYCDNLDKARNVTIVFGHLKRLKSYGYMTYRLTSNGDLIELNQPIGTWNLKTNELLYSNKPNEKLIYQSSVFVKSRKQYYICTAISSNVEIKYENMFYTLDSNSVWKKTLFQNMNFRFKGMFYVNNSVFGVDSNNDVKQFVWINQNDLTLKHISSEKGFFDCYGNSSFISQKDRKHTVTSYSGKSVSVLPTHHSKPLTELSVEKAVQNHNGFEFGFWFFIGIIIAILIASLFFGLAIYFIFFRRKTRQQSVSDNENMEKSTNTDISIHTIYSKTGQRVNQN